MNIGKYRVLSCEGFTAFDPSTEDFLWIADDMQNFKIANTQDNQEDTGKNGEVIGIRKRNKKAVITFTNGTLVTGAIASQLGVSPVEGNSIIKYTDTLVVSNNKAITKFKPTGTTGNEIGTIYQKKGSIIIKTFTQNATATKTGDFAYDPATKTITFFEGDIEDNTTLVVRYDIEVKNSQGVSNMSGKYSETIKAIVDLTVAEAGCNEEYFAQVIVPYLDCSGNFDIQAGDQSVLDFEGTCIKSGCTAASDAKYYDFIVYDLKDVK